MLQRKRALTGFPNLAQARPDLSTRLGPLPPLYPVGATRRLRFGIPPSPVGATRRLRIVPLGMVQPPPFFDLMMFVKRPGRSRRVDWAWLV